MLLLDSKCLCCLVLDVGRGGGCLVGLVWMGVAGGKACELGEGVESGLLVRAVEGKTVVREVELVKAVGG